MTSAFTVPPVHTSPQSSPSSPSLDTHPQCVWTSARQVALCGRQVCKVLHAARTWSGLELRPSTHFPPLVARGFRLQEPVIQGQSDDVRIIPNRLSIKVALRPGLRTAQQVRPVYSQGSPLLAGWMWVGLACVP